MKYSKALRLLPLFALSFIPGHVAWADDPTLIEVPVRRVLFPIKGYDDNDNVQIMIEGDLPDPCYVLGKQTISRDATGVFTVHQFAWRRQAGICGTGDLLGESDFSEEVSLGRLKAGDYSVKYEPKEGKTEFRRLNIEVAPVSATDNFNYPRITNLKVPDFVLEGNPAQIVLSGPFSSSCNKLKEPIAMEKQVDTFVIRPIEIILGDCGWSFQTFDRTIDLGILPPGKYLVHVRSKNGKAVEKTFQVFRNH